MRIILLTAILSPSILAASCGREVSSESKNQIMRCQIVYTQSCAIIACHGIHAEGIRDDKGFRVWPLIGEEFQHRSPTAQVIFDVVRSGGESSLRMLTDQQIYDAIAYELSLNGVLISEPLTFQNASTTYSGNSANTLDGNIYPPPDDTKLVFALSVDAFPVCGKNENLRLCVTQFAVVALIEGTIPPLGDQFVLIVVMLEDLADHSLTVAPQYLRLADKDGQLFKPLELILDYPVARFRTQIIEPEHGTSFLSIFALPQYSEISNILYTQPVEQQLVVNLFP